MQTAEKKLNPEEIARAGDEIYSTRIQTTLHAEDAGKYAVIDVESGDYEVSADEVAASDRLLARHPEAQVWLRQVGSPYARRFGRRAGVSLSCLKQL